MLLKLNLSLSLDLLSPVANKHLIGENIGPLFAGIFLVLHSLNSLHTRARCTFRHAHFYWCISASLTCGVQTSISFLQILWGPQFLELASLLFSFSRYNGQSTLLGLPPTGSASRLPPDLGTVSSRPGQYPSSQNPTDAPHWRQHHKIRGLTFIMFSLTHKHTHILS